MMRDQLTELLHGAKGTYIDEEKLEAIKKLEVTQNQNTIEKLSRICQFFRSFSSESQ